jgi:hypothetical protein
MRASPTEHENIIRVYPCSSVAKNLIFTTEDFLGFINKKITFFSFLVNRDHGKCPLKD